MFLGVFVEYATTRMTLRVELRSGEYLINAYLPMMLNALPHSRDRVANDCQAFLGPVDVRRDAAATDMQDVVAHDLTTAHAFECRPLASIGSRVFDRPSSWIDAGNTCYPLAQRIS